MLVPVLTYHRSGDPRCGRQGNELDWWSGPYNHLYSRAAQFSIQPQFPPAGTMQNLYPMRGREGSTWAACSPAGWRVPHRTGCGAALPVTAFPHAREHSSGSVFWGSRTLASVHRPTVHARSEPSTCPRGRLGSPGHGAWCWSHSTRWVQTRLHYDVL